jgi:hypothetical protein
MSQNAVVMIAAAIRTSEYIGQMRNKYAFFSPKPSGCGYQKLKIPICWIGCEDMDYLSWLSSVQWFTLSKKKPTGSKKVGNFCTSFWSRALLHEIGYLCIHSVQVTKCLCQWSSGTYLTHRGTKNLCEVVFSFSYLKTWSWNSAVGIVMCNGLDCWGVGVWVLVGARVFTFLFCPNQFLGTPKLPSSVSMEVKRLGHEADHSLPATASVKNTLVYTSFPPYVFMA